MKSDFACGIWIALLFIMSAQLHQCSDVKRIAAAAETIAAKRASP